METTAYYALGIPAYLALFGLESWAARRRGHPLPSMANSVSNISAGLGAIVVGLVVGPALIALYELAFRHVALVTWPSGSLVPWLLAVVLGDFANYWHHRLEHRFALFWAIHGVHHQPDEMNLTVGMRHAWFSDVYALPFYAALPILGVPTTHFFLAMAFVTLYAFLTHSAHFTFPSLGILVTPDSHVLHHASNPRYLDKNFAAMFRFWDRLFGTHVALDPADPPVYGTQRGYETHDGALAQWVLLRDLLRRARRESAWTQRLRLLLSRPGSVGEPQVTPPVRSTDLRRVTKVYVAIQVPVLVAFLLLVLAARGQASAWLVFAASVLVIATIATLGGLLDARRSAWAYEGARLSLFVPCAVALALALAVAR